MNTINFYAPQSCHAVVNRLIAAGYETYFVGGCVRDTLLNKEPHDWDICTSARPEETTALFGVENTIDTGGLKHGTVCIATPTGIVEVTTFRIESEYTDGRRPDVVHFVQDIQKDLSRRDFTINAMAYRADCGVIDPFYGQGDIQKKIIRCVGDAMERFQEDALRILRAIRFQSKTGFSIATETATAMRALKQNLNFISKERIREELVKTLMGPFALQALLDNSEIIAQIIPQFQETIGLEQHTPWHRYTLYEHIIHSVAYAKQENAEPEVLIALFFHDIAKPKCITEKNGVWHFYGHAHQSAITAKEIMKTLRFSNQQIEEVYTLIDLHDVHWAANKVAARRWLGRIGEKQLRRLILVSKCDALAQSELALENIAKLDQFEQVLDEVLQEETCFHIKDLAVTGNDVIRAGITQGPEVGKALRFLLEKVIKEELPNTKQDLLHALSAQDTEKTKKIPSYKR